jgi:hypothetical protein
MGYLLLPAVQDVTIEPETGAFLDIGEDFGTDTVEQRDFVGDQHLRAEVRVPTGDARFGVDDGGNPGRNQRIYGGAVQIGNIDNGDVTRVQALQQSGGSPIQASDPGDTGQ